MGRLAELREARDDFFGQRTLTHAIASFDLARSGATQMVDSDGNLDTGAVDTFHNFIDEFLRALAQLEAGEVPADAHFGPIKPDAKIIMDLTDQKKLAKEVARELVALKASANKVEGLQAVSFASAKDLELRQFPAHVERVVARIHVLLNRRGLGTITSDGNARSSPMRNHLENMVVSSRAAVAEDGTLVREQMTELKKYLKRAVEEIDALSGLLPPLLDARQGPRKKLILRDLEKLQKEFSGVSALKAG